MDICFFATSRSGLGHLRRVANIGAAVKRRSPNVELGLVTNASFAGLEKADLANFSERVVVARERMAEVPKNAARSVCVLDTMVLPEFEDRASPLALILRETPADRLGHFHLTRAWDQVLVANPPTHWMPPAPKNWARQVTPVGWIYRHPGSRRPRPASAVPRVLVASGGGGTPQTAMNLYAILDRILGAARRFAPKPFQVVQAIGPRAADLGRLTEADTVVDPGGRLDEMFRDADLVVSTAGYNSVLELAATDTPALLVPIPRSIDDQAARARLWGPRLGTFHDGTDVETTGRWLAERVTSGGRRRPVDLGPSGEDNAAAAILALV